MEEACYYFKEIQISEGFFDNIVDCCYILIMEGSERETDLVERLSKYGYPCKNIMIQYNKGFKNCEKVLKEQKSNYDIIHAYNNAFTHAKKQKYNNVMILEDDFIFTEKIQEPNVIKNIENLFENMEVNLFNFGPIMFIYNPLFLIYSKYNCVKGFLVSSAHCCIYSKKFYNKFTENYRLNIIKYKHFDLHFNSLFIDGIYTYNEPLCIQPVKDTENSDQWSQKRWVVKIMKKIIRFFELNTENPIEGYKKIRLVNYILNFIFYASIIYLIIMILKV